MSSRSRANADHDSGRREPLRSASQCAPADRSPAGDHDTIRLDARPAAEVREYRRSDFESIWELDQKCFPPGISYSRSELRAFLSRKTAEAIVVESGGRIVAFVLGWRRSRADGHVITLDVTASARRRGLGRQLMVELEARFRAAGVDRVRLETAVTNTIAIGFYERLGYRRVARLRGYYGPGLDAWEMEKALDDRCRPPGPTRRLRRKRSELRT